MATLSVIRTKVDEAITAAEGGDYSTAISKIESAKALLAITPDSKSELGEMGFDRAALDTLLDSYRMSKTSADAASGGIKQTKITYARATD